MARSIMAIIVVIAVAGGTVATVALEAEAAGPGWFRLRNRARTPAPTRTYRSYSIDPGTVDAPASAGSPGAVVVERPAPMPARPGRPSGSTPSYKRADSKAMGRFGQ